MRNIIILVLSTLIISCNNKDSLSAEEIVDRAILEAGGDRIRKSKIEFDFRDMTYCAVRGKNEFKLERMSIKDSMATIDILSNTYFLRIINDKDIELADSIKLKYSNSVNSVHYFSVLPYGLNDGAAKKRLLGETKIKDNRYYKIEVTFEEEGGGTDFDDIFVYWVNPKDFHVDYLAYEFHVDGGGVRFREAKNKRRINGVLFMDYNNYKPSDKDVSVYDLDSLFEDSRLEFLSSIELKNINVEECISC
ncbi:MAG: deoxyribose-phosphate aldolase [Bacteroidia bacterium]|nr:deoxyribose-phosphate aldolase [Bacteroidia bacterium]MBT8310574.1 deoxyribose-phosphate aldolase [Bacteroidia bacterium]NNK28242.1 deoxyribose-phosphate aldolase [Flavobacteriaceae bacterium]NNL60342.1 deoxyribose-phosphate aldolase [Flavobacteriaceae bacterium]